MDESRAEYLRSLTILDVRPVRLAGDHHTGDWPCSSCGADHAIAEGWLVTAYGGEGRTDHIVCPDCARRATTWIKPRRTVLVVDDDDEYRRALVRWLEADGLFEVCAESGDGDDALAKIEIHDPDLVVLDLRMPGRDGFEVLEELQRRETTAPTVVLTAYPSDDARTLSRALGSPLFLDKDTFSAAGLVMHLTQV